jgi:hypothetical protein
MVGMGGKQMALSAEERPDRMKVNEAARKCEEMVLKPNSWIGSGDAEYQRKSRSRASSATISPDKMGLTSGGCGEV